jgi:anhydro-N-acetylmuramic acid kinase
MKIYNVLGIMSGTSLDGLDLAFCRFWKEKIEWKYNIEKASTVAYSSYWHDQLANAHKLSLIEFLLLHKMYGQYIGEQVNSFCANKLYPDLIASHGHTIFHRPSEGLTFQIGDGATLAATCRVTTVCDFRSFDVALGGQGAPLVPAGDELLFGNYDYCLNLGGFANISYRLNNRRIAYDICPVNTVINYLAGLAGYKLDNNGDIGRSGNIITPMLEALDSIDYYNVPPPKSLGREWLEQFFMPVVSNNNYSIPDRLRTVYQHIAGQITKGLRKNKQASMLVTGGGAFNKFVIELISEMAGCNVIIPDETLIKYKEALIFAFLGLLRINHEINCLSSVTGAKSDSISGIVYYI